MDRIASVIECMKRNSAVFNAQQEQVTKRDRDITNQRMSKYVRERRASDPAFKLLCSLRARVRSAMRATGQRKHASTRELLGCTVVELWVHLETLFQPGMTRANHGLWHVDHKKPCAAFDMGDPEQQRACFHYTNLQPLWAVDNLRKSDKW